MSSKKGHREDGGVALAVDPIQRSKRGMPELAKAKDNAVATQRLISGRRGGRTGCAVCESGGLLSAAVDATRHQREREEGRGLPQRPHGSPAPAARHLRGT